jgi:alpha,alpha-trehalase
MKSSSGGTVIVRKITLAGAGSILGLAIFIAVANAQQAAPQPIETYIHNSWDGLSRSMSECKSVVDTKVTTAPILYLPAGMETPPAVLAMQKECAVQVAHLPRRITKMGDVKVAEIPKEGLLYLPNRYVVPGGRFNEMYGWDSYFILLGLVQDGRVPLAQGIVENFFFEIENYGAVLNANRTYFFTRSQPPLLSSMISEVYSRTQDKTWLARAYDYADRDYSLWTSPQHLAGKTGLARYSDIGNGPVPEMADDSTYYPDVVRWLITHPEVKTSYLVNGTAQPNPAQAAALAKTSCDVRTSRVCASAFADGHRLSAGFFRGDRAMRESGFDTSFRFGPFSGSTDEFAPVCLNSLLYKYARDMASFATALNREADAAKWNQRAEARKIAVNRYLWQPETGLFHDYNFVTGKTSDYNFVTAFYPLWSGLATPEQAAAVDKHLAVFEHEGGLAMSDRESGTQWDLPFGWAPTNWFGIVGLERYGFHADAARLTDAFSAAIKTNYQHDGTIREKYNVVSGSANVKVAAGYKSNAIGFGWTNGVYVSLQALEQKQGTATATTAAATTAIKGILHGQDLEKLVPVSVFFRGQTATVQMRNAGGIRFDDDAVMFAAKVDTGGYSSSVAERYQDYLVTEVPLSLGDKVLPAGAYGVGFLRDGFLVMDLGGNTLFTIPASTEADLRRPVPLQIVANGSRYRLYSGRSFVDFSRAPTKP